MIDIDKIEALAKAATQGKRTLIRYEHGGGRLCQLEPCELIADLYEEGDREFIAAMTPDTVLSLLARLRAAEAVCEALMMTYEDIPGSSMEPLKAWLKTKETP